MTVKKFSRNEKRKRSFKRFHEEKIEYYLDYCRKEPIIVTDAHNEVDVVEGDFNIRPHLHYVRFSCKFLSYVELQKIFSLHPIDQIKRYDHLKKNYARYYQTSIPHQNANSPLNVWTNPYNKFLPGIMLGISLPDEVYNAVFILKYLASKIPNLKTSYIEYAIDYMVDAPDKAIRLLQIFEQYLNAKWIQKDPLQLENYFKCSDLIRLYCRGKDRDKKKEISRWFYEDLDRIRCEYILTRGKKMVGSFKLNSIEDLINKTMFSKVIDNRIQFKQAKLSAKYFPKIWEKSYKSFHKTFKSYKAEYGQSRIGKDVEEMIAFNRLLRATEETVLRYENQWERVKKRLY